MNADEKNITEWPVRKTSNHGFINNSTSHVIQLPVSYGLE